MIVYKREERVFFPYCSQVFLVVVFGLLIILLCMNKEMGVSGVHLCTPSSCSVDSEEEEGIERREKEG